MSKSPKEYRDKLFYCKASMTWIMVFQHPGAAPALDINRMYGGSLEEVKVEHRLLTEALELANLWAKE
jgi:hypothetical protein